MRQTPYRCLFLVLLTSGWLLAGCPNQAPEIPPPLAMPDPAVEASPSDGTGGGGENAHGEVETPLFEPDFRSPTGATIAFLTAIEREDARLWLQSLDPESPLLEMTERRARLAPGHPQWSAYRAELWHVERVGPAYGSRETLVQVPLRPPGGDRVETRIVVRPTDGTWHVYDYTADPVGEMWREPRNIVDPTVSEAIRWQRFTEETAAGSLAVPEDLLRRLARAVLSAHRHENPREQERELLQVAMPLFAGEELYHALLPPFLTPLYREHPRLHRTLQQQYRQGLLQVAAMVDEDPSCRLAGYVELRRFALQRTEQITSYMRLCFEGPAGRFSLGVTLRCLDRPSPEWRVVGIGEAGVARDDQLLPEGDTTNRIEWPVVAEDGGLTPLSLRED